MNFKVLLLASIFLFIIFQNEKGITNTTNSIQFVKIGIPDSQISQEEIQELFDSSLDLANKELDKKGIQVFFKHQIPKEPQAFLVDPERNILLGIRQGGDEKLIDIICLKALDEKSIKPKEKLVEEIINKVRQHLVAEKTEGIVISSSGSKFDIRLLKNHLLSIDEKGYLRMDQKRIGYPMKEEYWILKAEHFRSYTILRLIEDKEIIRISDDYDLVRADNQGMFAETTKVHQLGIEEILQDCREDAKNFEGEYIFINRESLSVEVKEHLYEVLNQFPSP